MNSKLSSYFDIEGKVQIKGMKNYIYYAVGEEVLSFINEIGGDPKAFASIEIEKASSDTNLLEDWEIELIEKELMPLYEMILRQDDAELASAAP